MTIFNLLLVSSLLCSKSEVEKLLIGLNVTKAHGPDGIKRPSLPRRVLIKSLIGVARGF